MKFIVSKFIILIFLFLLPKYNNQCPTSSTPSSSEECTEQSTDDTACCYVEYSSGTICEELEITKSYRFILGFLSPSPFDSKENGVSLTMRYSPGFGDLSLENQKKVFALLNPQKYIGVTLNDSLLMSPSKSVTAIVGIGGCDNKDNCNNCNLENCEYRK